MTQHSCLKCRSKYEDNDPEDYYCFNCIEEKKRVAQEIDAKVRTVGQQPNGELQRYDSMRKAKGIFVNAKDLI